MKLFCLRVGVCGSLLAQPLMGQGDKEIGGEALRFELPPMIVPGQMLRAMDTFAQPVLLVDREDLTGRRQAGLGDSLDGLPGISSTSYFPGASRPIIRGFSNHRVRILRNGLDTIDASAGSLDHAVAIEPYRVEEIEIVRGPASLLYGGSGIGGVVNVVDNVVPRHPSTAVVQGRFEGSYQTVSEGTTGAFAVQTGVLPVEISVGGLRRRTGDLSIPGFGATDPQLQEQQQRGVLENSHVNTDEFFIGASRFFADGWVGGAAGRFRTNYGLGFEVENVLVGVENGEFLVERGFDDRVTIDLDQKRLDLRGEVVQPADFIQAMSWRAGVADYEHRELEDGEVGTVFQNRGFETRLEFAHVPVGILEGAFGFELGFSEFSATGDEAFLRPTDSWKAGLFALEEWTLEPLTWQIGARIDYQNITPDFSERDEEGVGLPPSYRRFGYSAAGGVLWEVAPGWQSGVTFSYTERLFNAQELYADGPHIGTFAYEISDHLNGANFHKEQAIGVDLSLRRKAGRVTGELSGFTQVFPTFVSLRRTGELAFENGDGDFEIVGRDEVDDTFIGREFIDVTRYQQSRALFVGAEVELVWHLVEEARPTDSSLDWTWRADWVRAEDRVVNEPLARIPPVRLGTELTWRMDGYFAGVDARHVTRQTRTAPFETETPSYTLVGVGFGRTWELEGAELLGFARVSNLFDEEARNHTSFVKDLAPLPGRNLTVGVSMTF